MGEVEIEVPKSKAEQYKCLLFDREKKTVLTKNKDSWLSIIMGTFLTLLVFGVLYRAIREVQSENTATATTLKILITKPNNTQFVIYQHQTENNSSLHDIRPKNHILVINQYENNSDVAQSILYKVRVKRSAPKHRWSQNGKRVLTQSIKPLHNKPRKSFGNGKLKIKKPVGGNEKKPREWKNRQLRSNVHQLHRRSVDNSTGVNGKSILTINNITTLNNTTDAALFHPISLQKVSKRSTNIQKINNQFFTENQEFQNLNEKKNNQEYSLGLNDPKILQEFSGDTIHRTIRFVNNDSSNINSTPNELNKTKDKYHFPNEMLHDDKKDLELITMNKTQTNKNSTDAEHIDNDASKPLKKYHAENGHKFQDSATTPRHMWSDIWMFWKRCVQRRRKHPNAFQGIPRQPFALELGLNAA